VTVQKRKSLPPSIVGHSSADGSTTPQNDPWTDNPLGTPAPQPSAARSSADSDWDPATSRSLAAREAEFKAAKAAVLNSGRDVTQSTSGAGFALKGGE
jgi:hypothetical protein